VKATEAKSKIGGSAAPSVTEKSETPNGAEDRIQCIATAAYYKAEARGFTPGQELNDWLEAEAEFENRKQCR